MHTNTNTNTALAAYRLSYASQQSLLLLVKAAKQAGRKALALGHRRIADSRPLAAPLGQRTNSYEQAVVALMLMKDTDLAYLDVARDDQALSLLMKLPYAATEKLIAAYLQGDFLYPTYKTLSDLLELLENTGVIGPGQ